jgi:hypothetical protein
MLTLNGEVLSRNDPRLWGSRGYQQGVHQVADPNAGDSGAGMMDAPASEYWDDFNTRHAGRRQLGSAGVSSGQEGQGFGELNINAINSGRVTYDPDYGFVVAPEDVDSADDPDDRARMRRIRNTMFAAMAAGAGGAMLGAGETAGAWGLAGEAPLSSAAYEAALAGSGATPGVLGDLGTVGLGSGVGTDAAGSLADYIPQGLRDAYGTVADYVGKIPSGVSNLLQSGGTGGGSWAGSNPLAALNAGAGNVVGGTVAGSAGGSLFSGTDIARLLLGIGGTAMNVRQSREAARQSAEQSELERQFRREMGLINSTNPFRSTNYAKDPETGMWTQTATLAPEEQESLDAARKERARRQALLATMELPTSPLGRAARYRPVSMGGSLLNAYPAETPPEGV